ncbi:single-stranded DNA-binding protein [Candidatus Microgenomates bacterium]|nr:single-stranded DNA-binding protein [Candidatus Microgenomates bacterium]
MATRSLNKVMLIGNLTRDPELRYTPQGSAVCTFGLATNRQWSTEAGEKKEEADFHRIVAWNKLAEICSRLLAKGRKVYIEGRLSTRSWTGQDGVNRQTTEIVAEDMMILDSKGMMGQEMEVPSDIGPAEEAATGEEKPDVPKASLSKSKSKKGASTEETTSDEEGGEMPF